MNIQKLLLLVLLIYANSIGGQTRYEQYINQALSGDAAAQVDIGYCYWGALGVERNDKSAFEWFSKAATQGNVDGLAFQGFFYVWGMGVKKDKEKGIEMIKKSIDQNSTKGMVLMGRCYADGKKVKKDPQAAFSYYKMAAEKGDAYGQYFLGEAYYTGLGTSKDILQAFNWYSKSAEQGYYYAQVALGNLYFQGNGIPRDYVIAKKWYEKAAKQGNKDAMANIDYSATYEKYIDPRNYDSNLYLNNIEAAKAGNSDAQVIIGECYLYGVGVSVNDKEAFQWFCKAADQWNLTAIACKGFSYLNGWGVKADTKKGLSLIEHSADANNIRGIIYLGYCYLHGFGVKINHKKAFQLIQKAADTGDDLAQNWLAWRYWNGDGTQKNKTTALYWFRKSAEQGNIFSQWKLGELYEKGNEVEKDYVKAMEWYCKSAAQGDKDAIDALVKLDKKAKEEKGYDLAQMIKEKGNSLQLEAKDNSQVIAHEEDTQKKNENSFAISGNKPQATLPTPETDINIPINNSSASNTFAVIIGNEQYENESMVPFAINDAKIFKEYVQKTLGVPEKQIRYVANAGLNNIRMFVRWLIQAMDVCNGKGKAIFYYAGHGIPSESEKTAYLLPVDGAGNDVESGYALTKLYNDLGECSAESVTIFLDACFSGAKREGEMMASARGVAIKVKPSEPKGNMIVFTAAQGDETAYPYIEKQHGMFTYYLLKKLQETKGNTTLGELSDYLVTEVKRQSFVENNKLQTPSVIPSSSIGKVWKSFLLK